MCLQPQDEASSGGDEAVFQDCAPSEAAAPDPHLMHDVEADSQSPVASSAKAAQEDADHRLAMQLQSQDRDSGGVMTNELSILHVSFLC